MRPPRIGTPRAGRPADASRCALRLVGPAPKAAIPAAGAPTEMSVPEPRAFREGRADARSDPDARAAGSAHRPPRYGDRATWRGLAGRRPGDTRTHRQAAPT